jgi:hypothetical protein
VTGRWRVTARPVVRKEIDADRLLQALLLMAREQAQAAEEEARREGHQGEDSP